MNRKELIEALNLFCIDTDCSPSDFVVLTGAALCLDGIVDDCRDIDLEVAPDVFEKFNKKDKLTRTTYLSNFDICCDNWEYYKNENNLSAYGFKLQNPADLLDLKMKTIDKYYNIFKEQHTLTVADILRSKLEKLQYACEYKYKHVD